MKTHKFLLIALLITSAGVLPSSAARTSANYSIPTDTVDAAGLRAQSASYSLKGSAVGEFGSATAIASSSAYTDKPGFVGQLYDLVSLSVTAPPSNNLNETASRQLLAAPLADDNTTLAALNPSTVAWSVVNGPIASISSAGLATAGNVFQDTPATLSGTASGVIGQLTLSIVNVTNDDFGIYAGDGIDDSWQVQYFGQNNPNAFPNVDPDGDGQNNLFEFTAGLVPTDPASRFSISTGGHPNTVGSFDIIFSPVLTGRTYSVQYKAGLADATWNILTGVTQTDNGNTRTVTDLNANGTKKFYRVQIVKP